MVGDEKDGRLGKKLDTVFGLPAFCENRTKQHGLGRTRYKPSIVDSFCPRKWSRVVVGEKS